MLLIIMESLYQDISLIRKTIEEARQSVGNDDFKIETYIMETIPKEYSEYPWLTKRLIKSNDEKILNKFLQELEAVQSGKQSLAFTELKLGNELKQIFIDPAIEKEKERLRNKN